MSAKWYTKRDGNEYGPYSWDQLVEYAREGRVLKDDQVKSEEMKKWVKASAQVGLFTPTPPTAPPPAPVEKSTVEKEEAAPKPKRSALKTVGLAVGGLLILLGLIFVVLVALNLDSPLEISNLELSDEVKDDLIPLNPRNSFGSSTDEIHLTLKVNNAKNDSFIEASWYYEDDDRLILSTKLDLKPEVDTATFSITIGQRWPVGTYRVDLVTSESGGEVAESAKFTIFEDGQSMEERFPGKNIYRGADFAVAFPRDWIYEVDGDKVFLSGQPGTKDYDAVAAIQSLNASYPNDDYRDLEEIIEWHMNDLEQYDGVVEDDKVRHEFVFDGQVLPVRYFVTAYLFEGKELIEWVALVKRKGPIVQEFIFTTPIEMNNDEYVALSLEIFNSLTFD